MTGSTAATIWSWYKPVKLFRFQTNIIQNVFVACVCAYVSFFSDRVFIVKKSFCGFPQKIIIINNTSFLASARPSSVRRTMLRRRLERVGTFRPRISDFSLPSREIRFSKIPDFASGAQVMSRERSFWRWIRHINNNQHGSRNAVCTGAMATVVKR